MAETISARLLALLSLLQGHRSRAGSELAERVWPGMGVLEAVDGDSCLLHLGAETIHDLVWMVTSTHTDFALVEGPEGLADAFGALARRCSLGAYPHGAVAGQLPVEFGAGQQDLAPGDTDR